MHRSIEEFAETIAQLGLSHVELAVALLCFKDANGLSTQITSGEAAAELRRLGLGNANVTRLKEALRRHPAVFSPSTGRYRLKLSERGALFKKFRLEAQLVNGPSGNQPHETKPAETPSISISRPAAKSVKGAPKPKPRVFIGSSREGLEIANHIQLGLEHDADCTVWNQGIFAPSNTTLASLLETRGKIDFAILVMTPDDQLEKRGNLVAATRDNVLIELGLFYGMLGTKRTAVVFPRDNKPDIPTDLLGVTAITYASRSDGNLEATLGPVCTQLRNFFKRAPNAPDPS